MLSYLLGLVLKVISIILFSTRKEFRCFNKYLLTTKVFVVKEIKGGDFEIAGAFYSKGDIRIEIVFKGVMKMASNLLHETVHKKQFVVGKGILENGCDDKYLLDFIRFRNEVRVKDSFMGKEYLDYICTRCEHEAHSVQAEFNSFYCIK